MSKRKWSLILTLVIALAMVLSLASCGDSGSTTSGTTAGGSTTTDGNTDDDGNDGDNQDPDVSMNKDGLPIVNDPVTYYFLGMQMNNTRPSNLGDTDMMMLLQEETNVVIDWELIPQTSWTEKKNLTVASGEYPDAFYGPKSLSHDEVQQYGADGVLIPLQDLLAEYAPNINAIREEYELYDGFITSSDGNIYQLAAFSDGGVDSMISMIISQEWLTNLGLQIPTDTEELYDVLKAFKENDANGNGDPDDEIPFTFLFQEGDDLNREVKRDFRPIYYAFGVIDTPFYISITDDDEVVFTATTDEWKDATSYMHRLYSEGLIDREIFTQDRTLLTNKLRTQRNVGAYTDYRKDLSMLDGEEQEAEYTFIPALKSPDGRQIWARSASYAEGSFAITSAAENPEVLIRWIDHYHQPEYAVQMGFGMFKEADYNEAEALVPSEEYPGKYEVNSHLRPEEVDPTEWFMTAPIAQGCVLLTRATADEYVAEKASSIAKDITCAVYRPNLTKWQYDYAYKFTPEEVEELSLLQQDIVGHVLRTQARWITEGGVEDEWENFVSQLENMNVERYTELYRTAFERIEG